MSNFYFHVSPEAFNDGDIKQKGSFGRLLASDTQYVHDDPDGEFFREQVRETHYPNKPSRLKSSFVFEVLEDAKIFRDRRGQGEKIYRVSFANEPTVTHRVCYTAWSMNHINLEYQAYEFWSNPPIYATDTELFAEVDLVIHGEA